MNYWKYISNGIGVKFFGVVLILFVLFYFAGLFMPGVNSLIELKYLAVIIGIPLALFFVGNYVSWRKRFRK